MSGFTTVTHDGFTTTSQAPEAEVRQALGIPDATQEATTEAPAATVIEGNTIVSTDGTEPAAPVKAEGEPQAEKDEAEAEPEAEKQDEPPTGRPWKLLHRTEKERNEAHRELKAAQARIAELEAKYSATPAAKPEPAARQPERQAEAPSGKPTEDQVGTVYQTYGDFVEALADWKAEQRIAALETQTKQREALQTFERIEAEGKKQFSDFQTVVQDALESGAVWSPLMTQIVLQHPDAHRLAYALAKNVAETRRIAALGDHPMAGVELGQFIARVLAESTTGPAPQAAPRSQAKPPIKPVSGASPAATESPDDLAFGPEYVRRMNEKEAARRRL